MTGRIVIISGPPGAGKSTTARALAQSSHQPSAVHLHTDDFYGYIRKGHVDPWLPAASAQNEVVANALTAVASTFAAGGYEVFVDGVVGPWLLGSWLELARNPAALTTGEPVAVDYVVLRPGEEVTVARMMARKLSFALKDADVARLLWRQFSDLGAYEPHAIDTTDEAPEQTVSRVRFQLATDRFRLK